MSKRIAVILIAIMLLQNGCMKQEAKQGTTIGQTDITPSASQTPSNSPAPTPTPTPTVTSKEPETADEDNGPGVKVSAFYEEGSTIIAALDNTWTSDAVYAYLYADQTVEDILISNVRELDGNKPVETEGTLYVPMLSAGQAVKLINPYPSFYDDDNYYTRIAYVDNNGDYQALLLHGGKENENPSLIPTESRIKNAVYDEYYLGEEQFIISDLLSAEFRERTLAGEFDDYIPKGLCIAGGTLGDVNNDGKQDALMYLISDGVRADHYMSVMPLFILTGQTDGKYTIERKVPNALYTPYRSASYAIAGKGYIDIVYDTVGGAACHHTHVYRFEYLSDIQDWSLIGVSYQPAYGLDYFETLPPKLIRPQPAIAGMQIEVLNGDEFYNCLPDWSYFDVVCELAVPDNVIYTLGINLNDETGRYEGCIYQYYDTIQAGGFIHTVSGEYTPGSEVEIYSNGNDYSFIIAQDIWKMSEYDNDAFYLIRQQGISD